MIKWFSEIDQNDVSECGGKGASLGAMRSHNIPIPNGFVLTTNAFGKSPDYWSDEVLEAFEKLACDYVAVRSSGTKEDGVDDSFAGQFSTHLFVTKETLLEKILECQLSVHSDRMHAYCKSKNIIINEIKVAVVIQKMIQSEVSGVCFTANPVNGKQNEIMIEAGYGIGEAIVSGLITPDNYIINKNSHIINKTISEQDKQLVIGGDEGGLKRKTIKPSLIDKQKLPDDKILILVDLVKDIEQYYGKPMDTERGLENGNIYMLQARPITTSLSDNISLEINKDDYTNYGRRVQNHLSGCFWCYWHKSSALQELLPSISFSGLLDLDGYYLGKKADEESLYLLIDSLYTQGKLQDFVKEAIKLFEKNKSNYLGTLHYKDNEPNSAIVKDFFHKNLEIVGLWWLNVLMGVALEKYLLNNNIISQEDLFELTHHNPEKTRLQKQHIGIQKIAQKINEMNIESVNMDILEQLQMRQEIVDFVDEFERYGTHHREGSGYTLQSAIQEINELLQDNESLQLKTKQSDKMNKSYARMSLFDLIVYRRTHFAEITAKVVYALRPLLDKAAQKIGLRGYDELIQLSHTEIIDLLNNKTGVDHAALKLREKGRGCIVINGTEKSLAGQELFHYIEYLVNSDNIGTGEDKLLGTTACKGRTLVGDAKIIFGPKDFGKFVPGDILVANETTPDFVPLMKIAGGIVTDFGGVTSHAAIVSRELNVPCIIGTKNATKLIQDGDTITLDTMQGIVFLSDTGGDA